MTVPDTVTDLAALLREAVRPAHTPTGRKSRTHARRRRRKRASKMSKSSKPLSKMNTPNAEAVPSPTPTPADEPKTLSPRRVLTSKEVTDIRIAYLVDKLPVAEICEIFGLPQSTVYTCARGTSYKHVPMPEGTELPDDGTPPRRHKVSAVAVAGIRADAAARNPNGTPKYTQAEIARKYGVSPPYVRGIVLEKFRANG